ncbi:hypothetical protein BGZ63DRAFT_424005 [Mariannaea sp. PMI_226]|nr:hypothetical protein BGZ63DRAFT_424005 [Mariannaea sp. PMI_226]
MATESSNDDRGGESSSGWEDSTGGDEPSSNVQSSTAPESSREEPSSDADAQSTKSQNKRKNKNKMKQRKTREGGSCADTTSTEDELEGDASFSSANFTTEEESANASTSHHDSAGNSYWSISENGLLRGMKTGGATWADIAGALRRHKKECQSHWKAIKDEQPLMSAAETTTTAPEGTEDDEEEEESEGEEGHQEQEQEEDEEETSDSDRSDDQVRFPQEDNKTECITGQKQAFCYAKGIQRSNKKKDRKRKEKRPFDFSKQDEKHQRRQQHQQGNKKKQYQEKDKPHKRDKICMAKKQSRAVNNKWHMGSTKNVKVAAENKKAKLRAARTREEKVLSGEEASSEISSSSTSSNLASPSSSSSSSSSYALTSSGYENSSDRHCEMRYLQDHIYTTLYPAEIYPEPDAYFSARDCRLLGLIDSKQKRNRWLEMQANFYNVTGRMVPLELIQDKCERAEEAAAAMAERARGGGGGDGCCARRKHRNIQRWVDQVSQEDLEDPET